jgi:hypothetical protein
LTGVRQLAEDTLVAAVDTLRALELLYQVRAEVDVAALEVVLVELRHLLALDGSDRSLRVLVDGTPWFPCSSAKTWHSCESELGDNQDAHQFHAKIVA